MTKSDIYCTFEGIWDGDVPSIFTITTSDCSISFSVINSPMLPMNVADGYKTLYAYIHVFSRVCCSFLLFLNTLYREWETSETSNEKPRYRWLSACCRFCCRCSDGKQSATKISFDLFPMFPLRWSYIWCWDAQPRVRILPVEVPEHRSYPRAYYEHPRFRK